MEYSAEPVSSADGQARDPLLIDDRIRDGTQRGRLGKGLMGAVPMVKLFILVQGVLRAQLFPDSQFVGVAYAANWDESCSLRTSWGGR
ncbi:hypothetical protein ACIBKY_50785 [Nonomuraea sp. NPDC050394]|uniref:hypothetical protein n=1 Tax=Nonomuraea sp. NPDC050394 TaxID=3364363 RepID=UPI003798D09F